MNYAPQLMLIGAVAAVGVLHTIVPDHWVPIALIARQRGWSRGETARAAVQAGIGHVGSTLVIAIAVWVAGVAFATRFGNIVDAATSLALIGFGGWIALSALREMHDAGGHAHHGHRHGHDAVTEAGGANHVHEEEHRFATDEGELRLYIFERGVPPHFRLSGVALDIARVETVRADGERQLFRFVEREDYWQSIEEIPEPHDFDFALMIDHRGHTHTFEGRFSEHDHGGDQPGHDHHDDDHDHEVRHEHGPGHDRLYLRNEGVAVATRHSHLHRHGPGVAHSHWHDHDADTLHVVMEEIGMAPPLHEHRHRTPARTALLLILGSSPMVEGIPAFFAAGKYGLGLILVMAAVFGMSTIAAYVFLCVYSTAGLQRISFGAVERYGEVLSGAFIALVGVIFWLFPIL